MILVEKDEGIVYDVKQVKFMAGNNTVLVFYETVRSGPVESHLELQQMHLHPSDGMVAYFRKNGMVNVSPGTSVEDSYFRLTF